MGSSLEIWEAIGRYSFSAGIAILVAGSCMLESHSSQSHFLVSRLEPDFSCRQAYVRVSHVTGRGNPLTLQYSHYEGFRGWPQAMCRDFSLLAHRFLQETMPLPNTLCRSYPSFVEHKLTAIVSGCDVVLGSVTSWGVNCKMWDICGLISYSLHVLLVPRHSYSTKMIRTLLFSNTQPSPSSYTKEINVNNNIGRFQGLNISRSVIPLTLS